MATVRELLDEAQQFRRQRDMRRVEQLARQVLQADPRQVEALHLLAISCHASGRLAEAVDEYRKLLHIDGTRADVANDLGTALAMAGRLDEAIRVFQQVVQLKPDFAEAHNNLGNALRLRNQAKKAVGHFRRALQLIPEYADAHFNLGLTLLDLGQPDQAMASFLEALRIRPDSTTALDTLRRTLEQHPNSPQIQNNLGNWFAGLGRLEEARTAYREAIRQRPGLIDAHNNLAIVLFRQAQIDEAIACCKEALRLKPDFASAHNNLGMIHRDMAHLDEAVACFQDAIRLQPDAPTFHSNLLGTLIYHPRYDAQAIAEEHARWAKQHARSLAPQTPSFAKDPSPHRCLRLGYVSADFSSHVVGLNLWPLIRQHDRQQFEITLYANMTVGDHITEYFRKSVDHWCGIAHWSDERVAERIRADEIDILVDLSVHSEGNRLLVFARKPAPVQVTFAGYPGSTGLTTVDYRLSDPYLDPPDQGDDCYSEATYRLPHSFWCYDPQTEEPAVGPLPAAKNGFITFGCLNNFCKLNDDVLALWARVLHAVPGSRLVLQARTEQHRRRVLDFLDQQSIDAERIAFLPRKPHQEYLALYHQIDIGLDSFPYNGHTTSLDSLWMGVPVVTLVGSTVVGRAGLSQLSNLGLQELAASTADDFVRCASELAADVPRLENLRAGLRPRMQESPLMNAEAFARGIEEAYRTMWRTWCATQQGQQPTAPARGAEKGAPVYRLPRADSLRRFSLYDLFADLPQLKVIDVGASPIDGLPPYQPLLEAGHVQVLGFEPDPGQHRALIAKNVPGATYLPHAIGDGSPGTLHICKAPSMTSLLEPDLEILRHFHGFAEWGTVTRTMEVTTKRLDDIPEAAGTDYLKLDLQGGELGVLQGATRLLEDVLVIHLEVQFVPFYKNQPLFAELDQALRRAGFYFHRFLPITSRVFLPLQIADNPYAGLSQQLWTDAVYVKRFTDFGRLPVTSLLKIAALLHDLYGSFDLSVLALQHADRQGNTERLKRYIEALKG
jgi:protein O-GlcNAc transferase